MLDLIIVGGGLHGVHLSAALLAAGQVSASRLVILDPHEALLARWAHCTGNVGMRSLRSPAVHNLDLDPMSLIRFAAAAGRSAELSSPYDRPSLSLFRDHCQDVIRRRGIGACFQQGRALRVDPFREGVRVHTDRGVLQARRVVLALGAGDHLSLPDWARRVLLATPSAPVHHVYDEGFRLDALSIGQGVAVVGGGIGAVQAALYLSARAPGRVTLFMRHAVRRHWFDSDPGWLGPKHMRGFLSTASWDARRGAIRAARNRGSIPNDLALQLDREVLAGRLLLRQAEVREARAIAGGVALDAGDGMWAGCAVVLGTGLSASLPGGELTRALAEVHGAPVAPCGYPIPSVRLEWAPGVFVAGPLAELELGPVARNIAGARRAAERLRAA